jgi:signal transduction histidine kinase
MTIRTRITLQFSVFTSVILITFSVIIYLLFSNFRHEEFVGRLKDKAMNSVKLLADVDEVSNELLKIIDRNAVNPMPREKVFIIDYQDKVVYDSPGADDTELSKALLDRIRLESTVEFSEGAGEGIGIFFKGKYDHYVVVASAFDQYGLSKLNYLRNILVVSDVSAIILIIVIGLFFSKQALQPLSNVVAQIDKITASKLNLRLDEGNSKDEIAQLAKKFNKMLERLDAAFAVQRSFVANASHELRTPLTTLTGQLEVTLMNDVGPKTKAILEPLLHEIRQLNRLSNGLLELTQASQDLSEISVSLTRIDELIGSAQVELVRRNHDYKIILEVNEFPDESWLIIMANEHLLRSALVNVFENACKYSEDSTAIVHLFFDEKNIHVRISDNGAGISQADLKFIFEPFYRAGNAKEQPGHGIGLTLTKKIIEIHNGTIHVDSRVGRGTTVDIILPHIPLQSDTRR